MYYLDTEIIHQVFFGIIDIITEDQITFEITITYFCSSAEVNVV